MSGIHKVDEGRDDEVTFCWDTFLDIHEKTNYIRMDKGDLIDFLINSEFLEEMGYRLEDIDEE